MTIQILKVPVNSAKVVTLVLGLIILGLGLHSYFQSSWYHQFAVFEKDKPPFVFRGYQICDIIKNSNKTVDTVCPSIHLERYYVSIITICFIISSAAFCGGFFIDYQLSPYKYLDIVYHCLSALLLLVGAMCYLASAVQVHNLLIYFDEALEGQLIEYGINFRQGEKVTAALFTIIQSFVYAVVTVMIIIN